MENENIEIWKTEFEDIQKIEERYDSLNKIAHSVLLKTIVLLKKGIDNRFDEYKQNYIKGVPFSDRIKRVSDKEIQTIKRVIIKYESFVSKNILKPSEWIMNGDIESIKRVGIENFCFIFLKRIYGIC